MKITESEVRLVEELDKFRKEYELETNFILKGFSAALDLCSKPENENTTAKNVLEIIQRIHSVVNSTVINLVPGDSLDTSTLKFRWKARNKEYFFSSKENNLKYFLYLLCLYKETLVLENNLIENIASDARNFLYLFSRITYAIEQIIQKYVQSSNSTNAN